MTEPRPMRADAIATLDTLELVRNAIDSMLTGERLVDPENLSDIAELMKIASRQARRQAEEDRRVQ